MPKPNNLNKRVWTAVYFVLAMLIGVFGGPYTYALLFAVILGLCLWEFLVMLLPHKIPQDTIRFWVAMVLGLTPFYDFCTYSYEMVTIISI